MTASSIDTKGRAIVARPLVLFLLGVGFLGLAFTAEAGAALPTPNLTGTNPVSPGASLTPRVKGTVGINDISVVTFGAFSGGLRPIAQDVEPDDTVRVYANATCTDPPVGEGTVADLKVDGIAVGEVAPESVTVYYANVSNELPETSACSDGLTYRQVDAPPEDPTIDSIDPSSPANDNFPRLIGTADPDATVSIYAGSSCAGSALVSGSGAVFGGGGIAVSVADNSDNTFSADLTIAGYVSNCSNSVSYQEVTPPPDPDPDPGPGPGPGPDPGPGDGGSGGGGSPSPPPPAPRLRTLPAGIANHNTPLIAGSAAWASSVRIYASPVCEGAPVARGSTAELAAGIPIRVVDNTVVAFAAVAVAGEKASKCSDPVVYVEDSLTPRTRITMGPGAKTARRKAVIRFTDTTGASPGTAFRCKVGKRKWKPCSSPLRLKKLKPRRYTVRVKASDPAGNVETRGAKRSFRVIARR